jgi:hypothetical protein
MDQFIIEKRLKWIPYNKFKNVKYLDKGGFSTIYRAIWLYKEVVLKQLNNLDENLNEFLNEVIIIHILFFFFNLILIYLC